VHVLELCEAENYVPNRVLGNVGAGRDAKRDASRKLDLLKRLTPQQRAYFDMKKGFVPSRDGQVIHNDQISLFDGLDQRVVVGLRGGFGSDLLKKMEEMSNNLAERDFASLGVDVVAELRTLLTKIASVI